MAFGKIPEDAATRVIVIGAGVGGITTGIALRRQLGHGNFTIYESGDEVGGTWRANSYPGCASDSPTHWYSLSTELNPNWEVTHVGQKQLKQYWKDVSAKHDLYKYIVFNTKVISAEWDDREQVYRIEVESSNGARQSDFARVLISGTGLLNTPNIPPELQGVKNFKGDWFHSARWNHTVDLRNKRVAVIGNGCSAAQFVPIITEEPLTQVTQFWRTAMWYLPKIRGPYSAFQRWVFAHVPLAMRLYRTYIWAMQELLYLLNIRGGPNSKIREKFMKSLTTYMKEHAPKKYHDILRPSYPFGCKRLIVDTGYYDCLHRPNIELNNDRILEVTETGIRTIKENIPFDVIILGTGFLPNDLPFRLCGSDGRTIQEYYKANGGPTAYYGTMTTGFPNFFVLSGPNTASGHGSAVFTEEIQVNYIAQVIKPILQGQAISFEPTQAASDAWNDNIQARLSKSVWSACASWYRADGGNGKFISLCPGTLTEFWWRLRSPIWGDLKATGAEKWRRRRLISKFLKIITTIGVLSVGYYAATNREVVDQYAVVAEEYAASATNQVLQLWK